MDISGLPEWTCVEIQADMPIGGPLFKGFIRGPTRAVKSGLIYDKSRLRVRLVSEFS